MTDTPTCPVCAWEMQGEMLDIHILGSNRPFYFCCPGCLGYFTTQKGVIAPTDLSEASELEARMVKLLHSVLVEVKKRRTRSPADAPII